MNDTRIITYSMILRIYRTPFKEYFDLNLDAMFSITEGFDMALFCSAIEFKGQPNELEKFVVKNYGIRSLLILRRINILPAARLKNDIQNNN